MNFLLPPSQSVDDCGVSSRYCSLSAYYSSTADDDVYKDFVVVVAGGVVGEWLACVYAIKIFGADKRTASAGVLFVFVYIPD